MKVIVGRESENSRLEIRTDDKKIVVGDINSVPRTVSRNHCELIADENGGYIIKNINPDNVTYVNNVSIDVKHITVNDKVELGRGMYKLDLNIFMNIFPNMIDIRKLKNVWENYHGGKIKTQIAERKFNAMGRITSIITMMAIVCSIFLGHSPIYLVLYGIAIVISLVLTIRAYKNATKVPITNDLMEDKFKKEYVCPNCHHFMGYQSYDMLIQNDNCPYCKVKYLK
jgi:hypothetical protein